MRLDGPLAIVPWVVVFGVGFAVGYALMSAMVDEPAVGEPQAVGDPPAPQVPDGVPASVADPGAATDEPTPPPVAMPDSAKPGSADLEGNAGAGADADAASPAADEPLEVDVAPEPKPWWEVCRVKDCEVDFGGITGGLSIRRAALEHGATVSWERDFASRPRQEVLPTEGRVKVKLRAVGLDASGKPVAAEISYQKRGGRTVQGVISLDLGEPGKQVIFRP